MKPKPLYIIGNGFDLHHGVASDYKSFRKFVERYKYDVFEIAKQYLYWEDELWDDFETQLANLEIDSVRDDCSHFLQSYGDENWSDASHHDYQYEIEKIVTALSIELHAMFCRWLRSLEVPSSHDVKDSYLQVIPHATFLNFNYTNSVEKIYGIPESQILYIHGKVDRDDRQIVIGHRGTKESANKGIDWESTDTRITDGNQFLDEYFERTSKPVEKIICDNEVLFRNQGNTNNVIVLGHSVGEVDFPYFETIARHVSKRATWNFSWHTDLDKQRIQRLANRLEITAERLHIFRLEEIKVSVAI